MAQRKQLVRSLTSSVVQTLFGEGEDIYNFLFRQTFDNADGSGAIGGTSEDPNRSLPSQDPRIIIEAGVMRGIDGLGFTIPDDRTTNESILTQSVLGGATIKLDIAKMVFGKNFDNLAMLIKDSLGNLICKIAFSSFNSNISISAFDRNETSSVIFRSGSVLDPVSGSLTCHVNTTAQTISIFSDVWELENNVDIDISDGESPGYLDVKSIDFFFQSIANDSTLKDVQVSALTVTRLGTPFDIEELIFDGVTNSPEVAMQGIDQHGIFDGTYMWMPYADFTDKADGTGDNLLRYNPATGVMDIIPLVETGVGRASVYQVIQSVDDANVLWIYSSWDGQENKRVLWKFFKDDTANSIPINLTATGFGGGKMASSMIGGVEHLLITVSTTGNVILFNTSTEAETVLSALGNYNYGVQADELENFFIANIGGKTIKALDSSGAETASIDTEGSPEDLAWDGEYLWVSSTTAESALVEKYLPHYAVDDTIDYFTPQAPHYTGSPAWALPACIKASDLYVVVPWEQRNAMTLGWSILNKSTGKWTDFWNSATNTKTAEGLYPYTGQYWNTVIAIIVGPDIYMSGYNTPNLYDDEILPEGATAHMRMLKFTRK
jgi:hypothetical protein